MDDLVIIILAAITAGIWIGWHIHSWIVLARLTRHPDAMIRLLEQYRDLQNNVDHGVPEDAIEVETEQVNGMVYAYNKASGEFLGQAQNLHQVLVLAAKRFPGKKFWHPELKEERRTA
jgi:hypothetical protein